MAQDTASRLQVRPIRVRPAAPPASTQTTVLILALVLPTYSVASTSARIRTVVCVEAGGAAGRTRMGRT